MPRHILSAVVLLPVLIASVPAVTAGQDAPLRMVARDAEIRKILAERVDTLTGGEQSVGIVVGVIGPQGRRVIAYGYSGKRDARAVDGDTCFEIGSATKIFTALLLAEMVGRGEVALADPAGKYLPGVKLPERSGRAITLIDLVMHTSGLPLMPDESAKGEGAARFYEFLAHYQLPRDSGTAWDYSNVGYWLLSQALSARAGADFETLLRDRVVAPLGLTRTAFTAPPGSQANCAVGHDVALQPAPSVFDVPVYKDLPAAGGLLSTANDLLQFLTATMDYERSPLTSAIALQRRTRRQLSPGRSQALGWMVSGEGDDQLFVHDGGTWGYASSIAFDPATGEGVVVLSSHVASVADLARHLLRPATPLVPPGKRRKEITVDAAGLDSYAGRYEARGEGIFVVLRERDFLTLELPADWGIPRMRLRPEALRDFFVAELPLRVTFETAEDGRVTGMLVYPPRGQKPVATKRINAERSPQP